MEAEVTFGTFGWEFLTWSIGCLTNETFALGTIFTFEFRHRAIGSVFCKNNIDNEIQQANLLNYYQGW